ncbi:tudor domain-containing protein 3 [Prunus yedoensis var. nudiflora]|uniref:Tudor domain-containing protein 3 n=1 Tax=Prunus yedoensis var. nudiflora TaxID=2094558 RepID=A0A314XMJ6_PRUYE|nr:tudor domain-containing protein 3 [Prunus yedoensis var. nudiflora]
MEESSGASDAAIETLKSRGWCFGDLEQVKAMIMIHSALADDTRTVVNSVESELTNMDLKSISAKSLPDPNTLRKSSHLLGPQVLQIAWVRDITRSSVEDFARNSTSRRLLKLGLTDGHSEVAAVEYSHIPSIPDDVVPGTKVRLEGRATIRNGIVCLNPKVVTLLGGVVQSLYEEWQMNKKYSGFSRSSLRVSQESDGNGPPPFEKLQVGVPKSRFPQQDKSSYYSDVNSKSSGPIARNVEVRPIGRQQDLHLKSNDVDNSDKKNDTDNKLTTDSLDEQTQDKPSSSAARPKEVIEAVPVQNQAAAQKLLQKMSHQNRDDRHSRAGAKPSIRNPFAQSSHDEELARQLQNQFDLEDYHVQKGPPRDVNAENIKMSMFNFQRDDNGGRGMGHEGEGKRKRKGAGEE